MIDLSKLKTQSIKERKSKVSLNEFVKSHNLHKLNFKEFEKFFKNIIPDILSGKNFKSLIQAIIDAKKKKKGVLFMFGAHIIKCGLSSIVIELIRQGFITCLATNGASLIHDFEIAYNGNTSEDVDDTLPEGKFGVTKETLQYLNEIAKYASDNNKGLGNTAGEKISKLKYANFSIFAQCFKYNVPITVHVGIGTDIIYQSENCDGASWGKASYDDFLKLCQHIPKLNKGGVVLNFGSAVILPEVFLKAINIGRNLGKKIQNFTAANFDMVRQYRPLTNIISRPVSKDGKGYDFAGHHEIMLPLLFTGIKSYE